MPHGDDHNGKHDGEFEGRTYLYIRTNAADTGAEPLAAGLKHWQSPDIMIVKPGGAIGTEAVANQVNQVRVTVTNAGGIEAVDAFLEVFYTDPSTGFTPATSTLIGSTFLTIPGYTASTVDLPWTPTSADAGHRCLMGRVALWVPPDHYVDGTVFDVKGDRHVAQRNIHVLSMGAKESMRFAFHIVNPLKRSGSFRVLAREVRSAKALDGIRQSLGCSFAQFGETPLRDIRMILGGSRFAVPTFVDERDLLMSRFTLPRTGLMRATQPNVVSRSVALDLKAGEVRQGLVYVRRNPETRKGDLHAIDITQLDEDGNVVGGLTLIVQH